ncbi:hypothetical protein GGI25_003322 [Coemansia spiralis]|uniref:RING-type domain-containing protein n=2 Tax=Coemansia TaxID=4863 RepID=A0A9W8G7D1_9FUNG|nr:hypothetical protein BX070DRAFT_222112 [Coemansia spiralis]KAJ1992790.1 hypothetical protein EDC05_002574 [Coemansia umbellata]KAJ2622553.1 hypothetical protein GGI26_003152 [Coemansia sp. RSA 1358]KAJ2677102.1 hypothetical protein GGI25_003322 [Coemansia spiralis]
MVSAVAISAASLVGLVCIGALITTIFHYIHRREINRDRHDPLYEPRIQYQPSDRPPKPEPVFEEHELSLLRLKVLTNDELQELVLTRLNQERRIVCGCSDGIVEVSENQRCECAPKNFFTPDCSICLAEFAAGDCVRILDCGHYFHRDCVDAWLTVHSACCPVCKTDMIAALDLPPRDNKAALNNSPHQVAYPPPAAVIAI